MNVRRSIIFSRTKNATVFNNDDEDEDVEESLVVVALLLLMFSILNLINAGILSDEHSDMTSNNQRIPLVMFGNEFATTSISILLLLLPFIFFPKSFDSNTSKHKSITLLGSNSKVPTSCHRYVNFLSSLSLSLSSLLSLPEQ